MTYGVTSVQYQCSIHDYNVIPIPFDTSFCCFNPLDIDSILALQSYSYLIENILSFNLVCNMRKSVKNCDTTSKFNIVST